MRKRPGPTLDQTYSASHSTVPIRCTAQTCWDCREGIDLAVGDVISRARVSSLAVRCTFGLLEPFSLRFWSGYGFWCRCGFWSGWVVGSGVLVVVGEDHIGQ